MNIVQHYDDSQQSQVFGSDNRGHPVKASAELASVPKRESLLTWGMNKFKEFTGGTSERGIKRNNSLRDVTNPNKDTEFLQRRFKSFSIGSNKSRNTGRDKALGESPPKRQKR